MPEHSRIPDVDARHGRGAAHDLDTVPKRLGYLRPLKQPDHQVAEHLAIQIRQLARVEDGNASLLLGGGSAAGNVEFEAQVAPLGVRLDGSFVATTPTADGFAVTLPAGAGPLLELVYDHADQQHEFDSKFGIGKEEFIEGILRHLRAPKPEPPTT